MRLEEAFTEVKPEVGHFRIFGCLVYIHVHKEKMIKLDLSGRKGTFVGYNESSKAYRIYIHGQRHIEVRKEVTFEEEVLFKRSKGSHMEIDQIDPIDPVDPIAPFDVPRDIAVGQKRPTWDRQSLQEAEGYVAPHGTFRVSKRPQRYSCYVAAMGHIIHFEPSCYEEETSHLVWRDAMMEEYQSIMKNDVWDIVLILSGKSIVTSKWIYKIKHIVGESIERHKMRFFARGFSQRYSCYAATMGHIIHFEPSCYEEETSHLVWRYSMMEEYQSIMKNYVWDIVSIFEGKSVVTSKWIYKIKYIVSGSIKRHKMRFVARDSLRDIHAMPQLWATSFILSHPVMRRKLVI
jgi:hypothetical protein